MATSGVKRRLRELFLVGLPVVLPLVVTYLLLRFLFESLDRLLDPIIQGTLGRRVPGPGLLATPAITAGFFLVVPEKSVIPVPISVEGALKLIVSGRLIVPAALQTHPTG